MYIALAAVCFCLLWTVHGDIGVTDNATTSSHQTTSSVVSANKTFVPYNKSTGVSHSAKTTILLLFSSSPPGYSSRRTTTSPQVHPSNRTTTLPPQVHPSNRTTTSPPQVHPSNRTTTLPPQVHPSNRTTTLPPQVHPSNRTTTFPPSGNSFNRTTTLPPSGNSFNRTTTLPSPRNSVNRTTSAPPPMNSINRTTRDNSTALVTRLNVGTNTRAPTTADGRHDQTSVRSTRGSPKTDLLPGMGSLIGTAGIDNILKQVFAGTGVDGSIIQTLMNTDTLGTLLESVFTGSNPSEALQNILKLQTAAKLEKLFNNIAGDGLPNESMQRLFENPIMQTVIREALKNRTYTDFIKVIISDVLSNEIFDQNMTDSLQELYGNRTGVVGVLLDVLPLLRQIRHLIEPSTLSSPDLCVADMAAYLQELFSSHMWAIQMFDASGKPGKSMRKGARSFLGNYDECHEIDEPVTNGTHTRGLRGQYWSMTFNLPSNFTKAIAGNTPPQSPGAGQNIQWDWCLPSSCEKSAVTNAIDELPLQRLGVKLVDATLVSMDDWKDDASAVTAVVIMTLITALSALGTGYDVISGWLSQRIKSEDGDPESEVDGHTNKMFVSDDGKRLRHVSVGISMVAMNGKRVYPPEELDSDDDDDEEEEEEEEEEDEDGVDEVVERRRDKHKVKKRSQPNQSKHESFCRQLLLSFSISKNTEKILNTKTGESNLGCIHGIRVLSMAWVILGHSVSWHKTLKFENPTDYMSTAKTFTMQAVMSGTLAVDTFFLLSGCLVCYLFLRETKKSHTGKPSIKQMILYYVHRYWRLTPVYMILIMLYTCLMRYLVDGPLSKIITSPDFDTCRGNWWINFLYINNLYKLEEMCLSWSWFLANDMQFYVIAPLAMLPIAFGFHAVGIVVMVLLFAVHICSYGVIEYQLHGASLFINRQAAYTTRIYLVPWCRVAPFAIGLLLGYILYRTKCKVKLPRYLLVLGWQIGLLIGLLCTYITYDAWKDGIPHWPTASVISYETLYRPCWALFVSWIIFVCCTRHGGVINSMLSWSAWQPLGRLTYAAYLIHPMLLTYTEFSVRSLVYFRNINTSYHFIGTFAVSYALAYIASVLVEAPCMGLEKAVLNKLKLKRS